MRGGSGGWRRERDVPEESSSSAVRGGTGVFSRNVCQKQPDFDAKAGARNAR